MRTFAVCVVCEVPRHPGAGPWLPWPEVMVRVLQLLVLASGVLLLTAAPTPESDQTTQLDDSSARSERSANLSHITGTARKIRMYIKNRYLQILPDGTVNGTGDDISDYTILQRTSVKAGQLKIQSVATCMYLCMDSCGLLYGSREFAEDCVFNEMIEQHHYNTYSSAKYSNNRRTVYLALNKRGVPRRVQVKAKSSLGKLSTYTRVLPQPVPLERVEQLAKKMMQFYPGDHHTLRHHQLCPPLPPQHVLETGDNERCRRRRKRRKRRRCREGEEENEECHKVKSDDETGRKRVALRKKCDEGDGKEKCQQKKLHMIGRKRKSRHEMKKLLRHLHHIRPRVGTINQRTEEDFTEEVDAVTMTTDEDYLSTTTSYSTDSLLLDTNDN